MKSWIAKFRISNALDTRQTPPRWVQRQAASSGELQRYEKDCAALETALRQGVPQCDPPAELHRAVVSALRASQPPATPAPVLWWLRSRLAPAALLAVALLAGIWLVKRPVSEPRTTAAVPPVTLAFDGQLELLHSDVTAPLTEELARLDSDLDHTTQFLLANLPSLNPPGIQ